MKLQKSRRGWSY